MISASQMWEEINEVSENLYLTDWEIQFLEDVEFRAKADELSGNQLNVLCKIYEKACQSKY